jgi:hypothetical protein
MRYGCNQRLRNAFYHWALTSLQNDDRSKEHYAQLRHAGHGHARALRGIADRLLAMLIAMLKTGQPYNTACCTKAPGPNIAGTCHGNRTSDHPLA